MTPENQQQRVSTALVKETIADLLLENVLLKKQLLSLGDKIQELQKQLEEKKVN